MAREPKESVREKILAAAKERFWRYGIKKTTIDEIAADAEVGKGSVYLHFESKEEIAIAIIGQYKRGTLERQEEIARDKHLSVVDRIKQVLILPICTSKEHCQNSPMVMELITEIKPQLSQKFQALLEREVEMIRTLIEEANDTNRMHVADPLRAAWILKTITLNYMPTHAGALLVDDPGEEIEQIFDLMYRGLK